jgi:multidrug efflux pump subunit AcrA (membrane-fusion protein)
MVTGGLSAKAVVDDLEARVASLTAAVRAAEADATAADAETRTLVVQLDNYNGFSPIAGTVVDKIVEVGEVVSPGFGAPGVVEVIDLGSLVVEIDVPETRLSQVKVGGPAEVVLDAYPTQRYRGAVKEIGRRVNRAKATVPIKVSFVDRPAEVLPDMAARVSFLSAAIDEQALKLPPKLVVPTEAVVQRDGADVVKERPATGGRAGSVARTARRRSSCSTTCARACSSPTSRLRRSTRSVATSFATAARSRCHAVSRSGRKRARSSPASVTRSGRRSGHKADEAGTRLGRRVGLAA